MGGRPQCVRRAAEGRVLAPRRRVGPVSATQVAPGGDFKEPFPHPGGWNLTVGPDWFRPTPQFVATLPADPVVLTKLLSADEERWKPGKMSSEPEQILPPMLSYTGSTQVPDGVTSTPKTPQPATFGSAVAAYPGPGDTQMRPLTVLASGLAPRPLRTAIIELLRSSASSKEKHADVETYTISYGNHELVVNVNTATSQLIGAANVTTQNFYGIPAGRGLSSAEFTYEITSGFGS
ncbi:hypothetical protein [Amycolatopsis sp. FDAARGOS 1241]|uniref:hypothetical protein n=1 Tax=Amycolatopsis sp. FDAARGOS 1241 TaxID=2778070 RepID=UPI00195043F3|nr:hypothetical protein [Amycolatopsis sp. FDAARGOS 1241]QRP46640.1 hypothetical protein I6J71_00725 [Amycolatopsis sp. FDAARGOS 1241]